MLVDVKDKFASLGIVKILKNKIDELEKLPDKGRLDESPKGLNSTTFGKNNIASGNFATAIGKENTASGEYSTAIGSDGTASGKYSTAIGNYNTASGESSTAIGWGNTASGDYSTVIGSDGTASGKYSYSEGVGCNATGGTSKRSGGAHAEGNITTASGSLGSHAEGHRTTASGESSHAEGYKTESEGKYSHTEGCETNAIGIASHAEGTGTIALFDNQHVEGKYNCLDDNYIHVVGNGTSNEDRSNAHTIDEKGNAWYSGDVSTKDGIGTLNGVLNSTNINLYPESGFIYIDNLGEHIVDINLEPGVYTCSCETSTTDYNFITFIFTDSDGEPVCEDCILEGNGSYVNTINLSEYGANKVKIRAASSMTIFNVQIEKGETKSDYQPYVKSINAIYERIDSKDKDLNDLNNKVSKLISCTIQARNFDSSVELTNLITALENNFQESTIGSTFNSTETDSTSGFWFGLKTSSSSGIALIISNLGLIYAVRKNSLNNDPTAWYIDDSKILSIPKTIIE